MPNPNDNNDLSGAIRSQLEASTRWIEQSIDPIMEELIGVKEMIEVGKL